MFDNSRGQISAEFILLVGFVLVIAIVVASNVGVNLELDQVMSSAKTGALEAINNLSYNNTGNIIRLNNMSFNNGVIKMSVYSRRSLTTGEINYIQNSALKSVSDALKIPVTGNQVQGRYNYTVVVVNN